MRLPWQRREKRESGGDFSDAVVRLIEAQAAGTAADASSTAAVEAAAGALSRALGGAEVVGEAWAREAVSPAVLAQIGRDLIRAGDSMHVIRVDGAGRVRLIPASSWHWEGTHDPGTWTVRVTAYGPSTSTTWNLPASAVVFARWGSNPGQPYIGTAPTSWAHTTARLGAELERSLADESAGPLAHLLPLPEGQQVDEAEDGSDPYAAVRTAITAARGRLVMPETLMGGAGRGKDAAPKRDWKAERVGPAPPEILAQLRADVFRHVLAATGTPPSLFMGEAGTAMRDAMRSWMIQTVLPMARLLEAELTAKLETPLRLKFDNYPLDLAGRAQAFQKLVAGGVAVNEALMTAGLLADE